MSRFFQGILALRDLFNRQMPAAGRTLPARPQQLSVEVAVPAHMVSAVTEELNMRVQRILQRVAAEGEAGAQSTLLMVGVRVDPPEQARVLH